MSRRLLATASFDCTVRIWDASSGSCLHVLQEHTAPVYSVSFSPDCMFLASGGMDHSVNVWKVKEGTLVKSFTGGGGVYETGWNGRGDKLSACLSNGVINVIPFSL